MAEGGASPASGAGSTADGPFRASGVDWSVVRASAWSGRFDEPAAEREYRHATRAETALRVRVLAWVGALFFLAGWAVDASLVGSGPRLLQLLAVRLAVVAIVAAAAAAASEARGHARLETTVTAAMGVVVGGTLTIVWLSPGGVMEHAVTVMVIALVLFLFVPIAPARTTWICVGFSLAFIGVVLVRFQPPPNQVALVGLYLLLVNLLGAAGDRLLQRAERRHFAALSAERRARQELLREAEARRGAENALAASEVRYRTLVETSPYAIVVHREGRIVYVNPAAVRIMGAAAAARLEGRHVTEFIDADDRELVRGRLERLNTTREEVPQAEFALRSLDGGKVRVEVVSSRAEFADGPAIQTVFSDITDRKALEDELRRLATVDTLTGARNRRSFFLQGEVEVGRARRHGRPLAAVMLDLDRFKTVNDRFGHAVGDEVLRAFGELCRATLRAEDIFGRIGGEEFVALLPEVESEAATVVAERLREEVEGMVIEAAGGPLAVTVSAGVTGLAGEDGSLDDLLKRADGALYEAKRAGRNRVVHR